MTELQFVKLNANHKNNKQLMKKATQITPELYDIRYGWSEIISRYKLSFLKAIHCKKCNTKYNKG